MNETTTYLKVLSLLLQYPDEAYFKRLPEIKSVARRMRPDPYKASIEAFITHLETGDPIHAQDQYTALFDMSPSSTPNTTYHLWGDGEKRARLLARLQQDYKRAGLVKSSSELPDYLPLILELVAAVPQTMGSEVIVESLEGIETLAARLKPIAAHYSGLIETLVEMSSEQAKGQFAASQECHLVWKDSDVSNPEERRADMNDENVCYVKSSPAAALTLFS